MNSIDESYKNAMQKVLDEGEWVKTRTGIDCLTLFGGIQIEHDMGTSFPIVGLKETSFKLVMGELLWFLSGSTDNDDLARFSEQDPSKTIWYENIKANGGPGNLYGHQWRRWNGKVDQISVIAETLITNPESRQIMLTSYNPSEAPKAALPPCHVMAHFRVINGRLNCHVFQRSCDMFLGVPFNLASYGALVHILCLAVGDEVDLKPGKLVWSGSDLHIYETHMRGVHEMMRRDPTMDKARFEMMKTLPAFLEVDKEEFLMQLSSRSLGTKMVEDLEGIRNLEFDKYTASDFILQNYNPRKAIKAPMAV